MAKKYDSRGRPILASDWNALANVPDYLEQLAALADPGSGIWTLGLDADTNTLQFLYGSIEQIRALADPGSGDWLLQFDGDLDEWSFVPKSGLLLYRGYVGADGSTGNRLPAGWSASKTATGQYDVTHNLGFPDATYLAVIPFPNDGFNKLAHVNHTGSPDGDKFTVEISDVAETGDADQAFFFLASPT